jgi:hypothetical protein
MFQYELTTPKSEEDQATQTWPVFIGQKYFSGISLVDTANLTHRKTKMEKHIKERDPWQDFFVFRGLNSLFY